MRIIKSLIVFTFIVSAHLSAMASSYRNYSPIRKYYQMLDSLKQGWNTWDTRSMFTQLYLPEAFAVKLALVDEQGNVTDDLRAGNQRNDAAVVRPHSHIGRNAYCEVDASWHGMAVKLRSASDGDRLIMLITPLSAGNKGKIRVLPEYAWHFSNRITWNDNIANDGQSHFHFSTRDNHVHMQGGVTAHDIEYADGNYYCDASAPVLVWTGDSLSIDEAEQMLTNIKKRYEQEQRAVYGRNYDVFNAMQSSLGWDTVYDPADDIVISPVSRNWNLNWGWIPDYGGYVLFEWDTFFASWMSSWVSRELAYTNAIEMTLPVDRLGFVPKSRSDHQNYTEDCSQPPVGSLCVWNIYQKFHEKWFLELLYPRLLTWNRWWINAREHDGLLCWGSNLKRIRMGERFTGGLQAAKYESGLDNSHMFDETEMIPETGLMNQQDVGLTSLYVMDCHYLSLIAKELGYKKDAKELTRREHLYRKNIQRFWCEEDGMFYNINTQTGLFNRRTSATNFYVLLAKAATPAQAKRIVKEHLMNEDEYWGEHVIPMTPKNDPAFGDQDYWRGRIWGPTNFLVYLGLLEYPDEQDARKALVEKSKQLMLKGWHENGYIYENWNGQTGAGGERYNSECFYHWGALMGFMTLLEDRQ